jgi:hypothetical protein
MLTMARRRSSRVLQRWVFEHVLEEREERFHRGVVGARGHSSHRPPEFGPMKGPDESVGTCLDSTGRSNTSRVEVSDGTAGGLDEDVDGQISDAIAGNASDPS